MNAIHRRFRIWLGLALLLVFPLVASAQTATGVGFASITIHDPVNGGTMPGYVFYPATQAKGVTPIGPYELHATRGAPAIAGAKPLVVISHGHGGSDLGHHDLAVYLASHGFVVATLEHPKDNFRDMSGTGTAQVLIGRPIQVKATISMLLNDPHWKTLIDANRIGVTGFSAGGYTALMVVGAIPNFNLFAPYCTRHPDDTGMCGTRKFQAALLRKSRQPSVEAYMAAMQKELLHWGTTSDPRVKAAFVMAPLGLIFDKTGLASIDRPTFLYYGQNDPVLIPKYNVLHIAPLIKTLAGIRMIRKAGHYVFLAPCSAQLKKEAPEICIDPAGVNRVAAHRQINANALAFFRKAFAKPSH